MKLPPVDKAILDSIDAGLALLPRQMSSPDARALLYAIGLQESLFKHRAQVVDGRPKAKGPARGFWQFERGGGCRGVITHAASRYWMHHVCTRRNVAFNARSLWNAIEHDDVLAAAAARLLLFTDPKKLPARGDERGAWNLYKRVWRPGKPKPETWPACYAYALLLVVERAES